MISIVIPSSEKSESEAFRQNLKFLNSFQEIEVICVDRSEAPTRAERLNLGFSRSRGQMVLFHHPRSQISSRGMERLLENQNRLMWGGFSHQFDCKHPLLQFTSWYSNRIRARWQGIVYLDHCIFFHRSLWTQDLPPVQIFEDTRLSQNFKKHSAPEIWPDLCTTSAIRFEKNGIWRQSLLNQILKIAFYCKVSDRWMNRIYERGLHLNASTENKGETKT